MTLKINQIGNGLTSFLTQLTADLAQSSSQAIESQLETEVTMWLYRESHRRRSAIERQSEAQCQRCGSQQAGDFMRNGRRARQLVTRYGVIDFWLP